MISLLPVIGVLVLALIAVAIPATWWWSREQRTRRRLRRAPRIAIAQFPSGSVGKVTGRVLDGETLVAPFSGRRCVAYHVLVEELRSIKSTSWHPVISEYAGVPFIIEDDTGRALVDPHEARMAFSAESTRRAGDLYRARRVDEAFLARHGLSMSEPNALRYHFKLRYREQTIELGEVVSGYGMGFREPDPDGVGQGAGYRDHPPTRLHFSSTKRAPVLLSDERGRTAGTLAGSAASTEGLPRKSG